MSIFHQFWMDSGAQNHPKTRTGMPPSTRSALMEHLMRTPGANKASRTRFLMVPARFGIDFGRIWAPKWIPKCFQNIQNLSLGFSRSILVLEGLSLPASGLQWASAGFAKRKQFVCVCVVVFEKCVEPFEIVWKLFESVFGNLFENVAGHF